LFNLSNKAAVDGISRAAPEPSKQNGRALLQYDRHKLRHDLIAGLTVAAVAVPQAMGYALLAGIPPEYGLYTAVVVTALGSIFGSSAHLMNGPTNAISLVVFSAIAGLTLNPGDPHPVQAVFLLALLVGFIQILIALFKLGDLTRYVSESVILGFMAGASLLIALGQVPNLLGLHAQGDGQLHFLHRFWLTLSEGGPVNWHAVALGLGTILAIAGLRWLNDYFDIEVPDMLGGLLLASVLVWLFAWGEAGAAGEAPILEVIPNVPNKLPGFHLPPLRYDWIRQLSGSALAIALLGLLEAIAIAKSIAARTHQSLDYNKQCLAEGLANVGGGLFQCMPGSGSLTRSAINFHAGAATRMSGLYAAIAVAITVLLFAPLARYVPKAALAGILLVTAWRLVDRARLVYCLKVTRFDALLALSTALCAVLLSIEFSILIGTFLSFLLFVPRAARLQVSELMVSPERVLRERTPADPQCTKLVLFALEGELFFGAAPELEGYLDEIRKRVEQGARVVVLRLKRVRNPDMVCLEILQRFLEEMNHRKVPVLFCGVRPDFARALENVNFHQWLPPDCLFLEEATTGSATLRAVRRAYELLGNDRCPTCPRPLEPEGGKDWYYVI
jgi:SulP family sulfate permease